MYNVAFNLSWLVYYTTNLPQLVPSPPRSQESRYPPTSECFISKANPITAIPRLLEDSNQEIVHKFDTVMRLFYDPSYSLVKSNTPFFNKRSTTISIITCLRNLRFGDVFWSLGCCGSVCYQALHPPEVALLLMRRRPQGSGWVVPSSRLPLISEISKNLGPIP